MPQAFKVMTNYLPMESNPELMNKYLQKLGVSNKWQMCDVMGLEGEPLSWVPRPVLAVILLFPLSDVYDQNRRKEETVISSKGQEVSKDVFHLKQTMASVCGTIALVHSVANNIHNIDLDDGPLKNYLRDAEGLDAAAKGALLENSMAVLEAYKAIALDDDGCQDNETPHNHFVTFVHKDGALYELDGKKDYPVNHGASSPETLLEDATAACRKYVAQDPDNIGFTVVALAAKQ